MEQNVNGNTKEKKKYRAALKWRDFTGGIEELLENNHFVKNQSTEIVFLGVDSIIANNEVEGPIAGIPCSIENLRPYVLSTPRKLLKLLSLLSKILSSDDERASADVQQMSANSLVELLNVFGMHSISQVHTADKQERIVQQEVTLYVYRNVLRVLNAAIQMPSLGDHIKLSLVNLLHAFEGRNVSKVLTHSYRTRTANSTHSSQ